MTTQIENFITAFANMQTCKNANTTNHMKVANKHDGINVTTFPVEPPQLEGMDSGEGGCQVLQREEHEKRGNPLLSVQNYSAARMGTSNNWINSRQKKLKKKFGLDEKGKERIEKILDKKHSREMATCRGNLEGVLW